MSRGLTVEWKTNENPIENLVQIEIHFRKLFLKDFSQYLGTQDEANIEEKRDQKQERG